ncbi:MAG: hypothetical protein COB30_019230 [Ectothiorhodospiraceae bacterium]|nr:hypothetical protein [Ectothiorhodospiraceae bacterium]
MKYANEELRESLVELQTQLEQERAWRQEGDLLLAGVSSLTMARDPEAVYVVLVDVLGPLLHFDDAALFSVDDGALVSMATGDHLLTGLRLGIDPALQRVLSGKPVALFDTSKQPAWATQSCALLGRVRSVLHIPVFLGDGSASEGKVGEGVAVLICVHAEKGFFAPRHTRIAQRIVPMVSAALLSIQGFQLRLKSERQRQAAVAITTQRDLLERALGSVGGGVGCVVSADLSPLGGTLHEILADWETPNAWWSRYRSRLELGNTVRISDTSPMGKRFIHEATLMDTSGDERLLLVADVTRWVLAEQALKDMNAELVITRDAALLANRAKSRFLANMSHELRTPLNAIMGYTQLLAEDAQARGEVEIQSDLEKVLLAATQLLSLIDGVLDLSKIEAERIGMNMDWIDLDGLLGEVCVTIAPIIKQQDNILRVAHTVPQSKIWADKKRLQQVLLNLLSNAAKFTTAGSITIYVALRVLDGRREQLAFEVRDTGIGIPADCLEDVFQPFSQVDTSSTREYGGTGLGLTISRRYCELMGGSLEVVSAENAGSTFTVLLPIADSPHHDEGITSATSANGCEV